MMYYKNGRINLSILSLIALLFAACGESQDKNDPAGGGFTSDTALSEAALDEATVSAMLTEEPNGDGVASDAEGVMGDADAPSEDDVVASHDADAEKPAPLCSYKSKRNDIRAVFDEDGDGHLNKAEREELLNAVAAVRTSTDGYDHRGLGKGRRFIRRHHGDIFKRIVWAYDVDGDRKLSDDERAALAAAIEARCEARKAIVLGEYDTNKDGTLDDAEQQAAVEAIIQARQARRKAFFDTYDVNHDGRLSFAERLQIREDMRNKRREIRQDVLNKYDTNQDKHLDASELAVLKADIRTAFERGDDLKTFFESLK